MPTVSWSEISLFRKCKKAHDYRYRQNLKKKRASAPLIKGKILHAMLDAFVQTKSSANYTGPDPWDTLDQYEQKYDSLFKQEREEYGPIIEDCGTIFENYLRYYKNDPLHYGESEVFVATDLTDDLRFIGYIDKIATDKQGRRCLIDHKFVKTIPSNDDIFVELQLLIYVWAWERFNPSRPIDLIVWDYGRTKIPVIPELLKSGEELTKRKNIDTDVRTYKQAINKHGFDPSDYEEILESLEGNEDKFFERIPLPRPSNKMIQTIVDDFRTDAIIIQKLKGIAPRSMNQFNCKNCEFRSLCEAEVRGLDADFIRKTQYRKRESSRDKDYANQEIED